MKGRTIWRVVLGVVLVGGLVAAWQWWQSRQPQLPAGIVSGNGFVILAAVTLSLVFVVQRLLSVPIAGSLPLYLGGTALYLFFAAALGIFLGTIARSMAQFALLAILVVLVLQLLSGESVPVESQPHWLQHLTFLMPSRHYVSFSQAIIYRGAGLDIVWHEFVIVTGLGLVCFLASLGLFRRAIARST